MNGGYGVWYILLNLHMCKKLRPGCFWVFFISYVHSIDLTFSCIINTSMFCITHEHCLVTPVQTLNGLHDVYLTSIRDSMKPLFILSAMFLMVIKQIGYKVTNLVRCFRKWYLQGENELQQKSNPAMVVPVWKYILEKFYMEFKKTLNVFPCWVSEMP